MVTRKRGSANSRTGAASAAAKKKPVTRAPAAAQAQTTTKRGKPAAEPVATKPKAAAAAKPHKQKLVRDSFTIPRDEYGELANLKQRAAKLGHLCKKSEVLRAGLKALVSMNDAKLLAALKVVPSLKTGRPTAEKTTEDNSEPLARPSPKK